MLSRVGVSTLRLARRLTAILPDTTPDEALDPMRIHSVASYTVSPTAVVTTRPFRAPVIRFRARV
jgi:predicted ATPase with chaperone activity